MTGLGQAQRLRAGQRWLQAAVAVIVMMLVVSGSLAIHSHRSAPTTDPVIRAGQELPILEQAPTDPHILRWRPVGKVQNPLTVQVRVRCHAPIGALVTATSAAVSVSVIARRRGPCVSQGDRTYTLAVPGGVRGRALLGAT